MKLKIFTLLLVTHLAVGAFGVGVGIYIFPILTAPPAPTTSQISALSSKAKYKAEFIKELKGSDSFHWGVGTVSLGSGYITLMGELAPGPDYKLYLSPDFVETEADFNRLKSTMVRVGDVKTFENFAVKVPSSIDVSQYNSVIIWCEAFGEFITAAQYQ